MYRVYVLHRADVKHKHDTIPNLTISVQLQTGCQSWLESTAYPAIQIISEEKRYEFPKDICAKKQCNELDQNWIAGITLPTNAKKKERKMFCICLYF